MKNVKIFSLSLFIFSVVFTFISCGNSKINAEYYVSSYENNRYRSKGFGAYYQYYTEVIELLIPLKDENTNILELISFYRQHQIREDSGDDLVGNWNYQFRKITYTIKNGNEIYFIQKDGTVNDSIYWMIEGNAIVTNNGQELIGMTESQFRKATRLGTDILPQDYAKKVKQGKITPFYQK